MKDIDDLILESISISFKGVKEISEELFLPYVRVAVRLRWLRKANMVIIIQSDKQFVRGVKPLLYKKK